MYFVLNKLYNDLNRYDYISIYGIGMYAKSIYTKLCSMGIKKKIKSFVVSGTPEKDYIDDVPIYSVIDIEQDNNEVFLLAVSQKWDNEIQNILKELGICNYISLCVYERNSELSMLKLEDAGWNKWREYIIDWHMFAKSRTRGFSTKEISQNRIQYLEKVRMNQEKNTKQIVFIVGYASPRTLKIINSLIKKEYSIILLSYGGWWCMDVLKNDIINLPIIYKHCEEIEELLYESLKFNPQVYFFQPTWGDCSWSNVMLNLKDVYGKIIIDIIDVMKGVYVGQTEKQYEDEKKSLENADGIIWRYFAKEYLEAKYGYKYKGKSLQFLDYCYGDKELKKKNTEDKLKICFVSGALGAYLSDSENDKNVWKPAKIFEILEKLGNDDRVEFHLIAGMISNDEKEKLKNLKKEYSNFDYFCGIDSKYLVNVLSKYDYASFIFRGTIQMDEGTYTAAAYIISSSNKHFDYIDAGLPIISCISQETCNYLNQYGVIVDMNLEELDIDKLIKDKDKYKENLIKARKELSIDNQINRLIDFINNL